MNGIICDQTLDRPPRKSAYRRTLIVIIITAATMTGEIIAGFFYGSIALLADGIHMGAHTFALLITLLSYVLARRHNNNPNFAFSSGKVGVLGGYTNAIMLGISALFMVKEAIERFFNPEVIQFDQALLVAVMGLVVNIVSAIVLAGGESEHHDHNLKAAYVHVISDALTSILAIAALAIGKWFGLIWLDSAVALIGAGVIMKWAYSLLTSSGRILVDYYASVEDVGKIKNLVKKENGQVADLHIWRTCEQTKCAIIKLKGITPEHRSHLTEQLTRECGLNHLTLELD